MTNPASTCPHCHEAIDSQAMVCSNCGKDVSSAALVPPESHEPPESSGLAVSIEPSEPSKPSEPYSAKVPPSPAPEHEHEHEHEPSEPYSAQISPSSPEPTPQSDEFHHRHEQESFLIFLRKQIQIFENSMAWNEVWLFLTWGFLFLTAFLN